MKPFPWRAGMRSLPMADDCARIVIGIDPGYVYGVRAGDLRARPDCAALRYDAQPDPTDGTTLGALLQAVRAAYSDPRAYCMFSRSIGAWVFCSFGRDPIESYVSEFSALLAAWEAAP